MDIPTPELWSSATRSRSDEDARNVTQRTFVPPINRVTQHGVAQCDRPACRNREGGVGGVEAGEMFLDRGHDPPLLVQRRQRYGGLIKPRLRDVNHSGAMGLTLKRPERRQQHVPMEATIDA